MSEGRKSFLKMFGLTGAAFAGAAGKDFDLVTDPTVEPIEKHVAQLAEPGLSKTGLRSNGYILPNYMDIQKGRLYSAAEFQCVDNHLQFFHYAVGHFLQPHGQRASVIDTNMCRSMALPPPESFAVKQVGMVFSPLCDPEDRSRFIDQSVVEVWLGQKQYFRRPLAEMFGVGETSKEFPECPVKALVDLDPLPLMLENQMMFYGQVQTKPWDYNKKIRCWLVYEGLHARAVQ